ncbi:MAG TPA: hypothetical protein VHK91_02925, partial [Flavisolibacter sp.]|nr:hypothetical protein [Flavisolibacter sp.]
MFRFLSLLVIVVLVSCSDGKEEKALLEQPPYAPLTDSIKKMPERADLYYHRGVLLYQAEEKEEAEKDLRKAWAIDPQEAYALSLVTLLREKSPDSAIVFIQQALKKIPGSIALSVGLARGFQQKNDTTAALSVTENILQQYPGQLDALTLKSELLSGQDKQTESLKTLEKAHHLVPSDPAIAYDLAYAYATASDARTLAITDSL